MLYNDRGMKKWQGFMLSEHNLQLSEKKREYQRVVEEREQQTEQEIGSILERAFRNQKSVSIQVNYTENGLYEEDTVGVIRGFEDGSIYLSNNGDTKVVELSMIRNVTTIMAKKWYE